jgi:transcriptional regulator with XRE-family HTH domain
MTNTKKLGIALRNLRMSKDLTQIQVADVMGKTNKTVCAIEAGKAFSSKSLELYMEAVSVEKIIFL